MSNRARGIRRPQEPHWRIKVGTERAGSAALSMAPLLCVTVASRSCPERARAQASAAHCCAARGVIGGQHTQSISSWSSAFGGVIGSR
jgi:hypothetical protein